MADISVITLPDGSEYNIKDSVARTTGSSSTNGIVKLSDATNGTQAANNGGTAATPKAVSDALAAAKAYADTVGGGTAVTINTWGN